MTAQKFTAKISNEIALESIRVVLHSIVNAPERGALGLSSHPESFRDEFTEALILREFEPTAARLRSISNNFETQLSKTRRAVQNLLNNAHLD